MGTMVWVVSRFRIKAPPDISSSCISPLTSSGQRSRASWASQPQKSATLSPQPGRKPRKFIRTCGGIGEGGKEKKISNRRMCHTEGGDKRDSNKCNSHGRIMCRRDLDSSESTVHSWLNLPLTLQLCTCYLSHRFVLPNNQAIWRKEI